MERLGGGGGLTGGISIRVDVDIDKFEFLAGVIAHIGSSSLIRRIETISIVFPSPPPLPNNKRVQAVFCFMIIVCF